MVAFFSDYPSNLVFSVLLSLAVIIVLWHYLSETREKASPPTLARAVAAYVVNGFRNLPEFSDLQISHSFPIYTLSSQEITAYDVKLVDGSGSDNGYILVNLDRDDSPVLEFATEGLSLREQLKEKVGHDDFRAVWLTPTYTVALDSEGKILASIGDYNVDKETYERIKDQEMSDMEYLSLIWAEMLKDRSNFKKTIREEWEDLPGGGKKTSDLVKEDHPLTNFTAYYAEGYERSPLLHQIDPNTGENNTDNYSGCGPTAWAIFIAWHDLLWTPELLRGSQNENETAWGPVGSPNREEANECYIDRITMELADDDYLDVYGVFWNDTGYTSYGDMEKGFGFIKNELGHNYSSKKIWESHGTSVRMTLKYIRDHERPVVINTPGHYCVAEGFLRNWNSDNIDKQWLYINTGWGSKKYLKSEHLNRVWYTRHVSPRTQHTYNINSNHGPTFCTTKSQLSPTYQYLDKLWMFFLDADGTVKYMTGADGNIPDMANIKSLNRQAIFTPSVCTDGKYIYLVYVDENKAIHLMLLNLSKTQEGWQELDFPNTRTEVRPAITGGVGDWLTIAFFEPEHGVQKIATNKDILRANAWPSHLNIHYDPSSGLQNYWIPIYGLTYQTIDNLGIVRFRDRTIVCWEPYYHEVAFWIAEHDGAYLGYVDKRPSSNIVSGTSLVVSNNTLFITYRDYNGRIAVDSLVVSPGYTDIWGIHHPANVWVTQRAWLTETCVGDPNICFTEREQGDHPTLILGWLNADSKLVIRDLSIDTDFNPINYEGHP